MRVWLQLVYWLKLMWLPQALRCVRVLYQYLLLLGFKLFMSPVI